MRNIKISSTYADHATIKRYHNKPNERIICAPVTLGLGFSCVITENIGEPEHSALFGFHIPTDHPQIQHTALNCRRKIKQAELDTIIDALEQVDTSYLKQLIADMFWLPPELQKPVISHKPNQRAKLPRITERQPDLFEPA